MSNMENLELSKNYLETLPSAELLALADDFGLDIPENLSRRFIIGELLEVLDDINADSNSKNDSMSEDVPNTLPLAYNETQISVVLKNPAWVFVYWDIHEDELNKIKNTAGFISLCLRIAFFPGNVEGTKASDTFDLSVSLTDRAQYILLPAGDKFLRADLVAEFKNASAQTLAYSRKIPVPSISDKNWMPVPEMRISPVLELSGFKELLKAHYSNHRHSFL